MYRKILVPLDGSELAEQVLPHVETLARCTGASVVLLRVPLYLYEGGSSPMAMAGYMPVFLPVTASKEEVQKEVMQYLDKVGDALRSRGLQVSTALREGNAGEAIIEFAKTEGVDLIAMSTHGRTGLGRAMFGSVAEQVLHGAGKPVLLVRPQL